MFWYKADIRPPFRLCDDMFWKLAQEQGSDDDEDEEELYDPSSMPTRRNAPIINVNKTYM